MTAPLLPAIVMVLLFCTGPVLAQRDSALRVRLLDGAEVSLYQRRNLEGPALGYQYAPFNLRLSEREGVKEFTFLAYRPDSTEEITGGLLHFLLTWGPTPAQGRELESLLRMRTDSSRYVAGSLMLDRDPAAPTLEIGPSEHRLAQLLNRSLNSVASPPVTAGGKMAASFSFSAEDARTLTETLTDLKAWKEVYLRIRLVPFKSGYYPGLPPAFTLTTSFAQCLASL